MAPIKSQNSNMLLAFLTLLGVIAIVAVVGFFMLRKGPEIIQGQAEVTEYRVSSKVPGRILEFRVKEGQSVNAGDTLAILEAPDVVAKMEQARAAEAAAQAQNEIQSPNQKIPDRKTKCVIKTHINIKQNVIFSAKLKPV